MGDIRIYNQATNQRSTKHQPKINQRSTNKRNKGTKKQGNKLKRILTYPKKTGFLMRWEFPSLNLLRNLGWWRAGRQARRTSKTPILRT